MQKILSLMLAVTLAGCVAHSKQVDIDSYTSKKIDDIIENQVKPGNKDNPGEMIKKYLLSVSQYALCRKQTGRLPN